MRFGRQRIPGQRIRGTDVQCRLRIGQLGCGVTGVNQNNVELALRAKLRYNNDSPAVAENYFPYDDDHTYNFEPSDGDPPAGKSIFNFEFSINSDVGASGASPSRTLGELTYLLSIDRDPSAATDFYAYDVINAPNGGSADHAMGFNDTANGGGDASEANYSDKLNTYNYAQQSWNLGFTGDTGFTLDPQTEGLYTFSLSAFDGDTELASTSIDVRVGAVPPVPVPATLPLLFGALGFGGFALRRRKG